MKAELTRKVPDEGHWEMKSAIRESRTLTAINLKLTLNIIFMLKAVANNVDNFNRMGAVTLFLFMQFLVKSKSKREEKNTSSQLSCQ